MRWGTGAGVRWGVEKGEVGRIALSWWRLQDKGLLRRVVSGVAGLPGLGQREPRLALTRPLLCLPVLPRSQQRLH